MKVLLDHCVPKPFARLLVGHEVRTARMMGWEGLTNGVLLAQASSEFDVFVTIDKNLMNQQNRADLPLPVLVLIVLDNSMESVSPLAPLTIKVLDQSLMRRVYLIRLDEP